jgi:hypothetical protein
MWTDLGKCDSQAPVNPILADPPEPLSTARHD